MADGTRRDHATRQLYLTKHECVKNTLAAPSPSRASCSTKLHRMDIGIALSLSSIDDYDVHACTI
jgi:hypothetical protein